MDKETFRGFLALPLSKETKRYVTQVASSIRHPNDDCKWVLEDNYHITLRFLDEITPSKAKEVMDALREKLTVRDQLSLALGQLHYLPNLRHPRVLACLVRPINDVLKLFWNIENILASFDFRADKHGYIPHVTLARTTRVLDFVLSDYADDRTPLVAKEIVLYQSLQEAHGVKYHKLDSIALEEVHAE
ncbi:MAG: RNA 2',3'-cyclic phosphodiesterase [Gammaproteobacteria bacterium]